MPFFRKWPTVVEAHQYLGYKQHLIIGKPIPDGVKFRASGPYVTTKQGQDVDIGTGEWVITESDRSGHYPCDPVVFEAIYEPVDDGQCSDERVCDL